MSFVRINKDGSMNDLHHKLNVKNICNQLQKVCNSQGEKKVQELYYWNHDNSVIKCYGWYEGDAGFENKHDLPPSGISSELDEDSSTILLFGDLFIVRFEDNKIRNIDVSNYAEFYNICFEGFDDCEEDTDDGYENESHEEDGDYIINEKEEDEDEPLEYESNESIDDEQLEEDDNEYE